MRTGILALIICNLFWIAGYSQSDMSTSWQDFFSYNQIRDLMISEERIYAIADNAAFIYDRNDGSIDKRSSVHGLSGKETSSLHFSQTTERFVIGYQSGLLEIIDADGKITIANDIERLDITGQKMINHISESDGKLYLSTPFGIVIYDIEKLQFGETLYIDEGSNPVFVNETLVADGLIYAATQKGLYRADANDPNLVDSGQWLQPEGDFLGEFLSLNHFDEKVYAAKGWAFYEVGLNDQLILIRGFNAKVIDLRNRQGLLTASLVKEVYVFNQNLQRVYQNLNDPEIDFELNAAVAESDRIFMASRSSGIITQSFTGMNYDFILPDGPTSNQVFSITAAASELWVVYGGYDGAYTPLGNRLGYSHFIGSEGPEGKWINKGYNVNFPARDLVHVTIDPSHENRAYLSSWNSGVLVVENDEPKVLWDESNSGLEDLYPEGSSESSIRVNGSAFDDRGNLWFANAWVPNRVKKYEQNENWKSYDMSPVITNTAFGLSELVIDRSGSIWIGSRRNGALVFNENGDRKRALLTEATKGSLPDLNVRTLAVDRNNRIWIGTQKGLVVFDDASGVFDADIYDAYPVIIEDDGIPKKLLGDQPVNTIAIDGAQNKWFGTDTGGVIATNPSGSETLYLFHKDNSPLPSNRILKISIDPSDGRVYFATDKGIVAFDSNVAPYGESLDEVYAYPNPVRKDHDQVIIDGRNGTHLPKGTNVKILDIAGRLVHETNVDIGQESFGGKVVWDKRNLRGRKVASGVYIVLLTSPDKSETASTKIAIIN